MKSFLVTCLLPAAIFSVNVAHCQEVAMREYTSEKGKKLTAAIIGFDGDKVGFMLKQGKTIYYPIAKLSQKDQQFLKAHPLKSLPKIDCEYLAPYPVINEKDELHYIDRFGKEAFKAKWQSKSYYVGKHAKVLYKDGDHAFVDVKGKQVLNSKGSWMLVGEFTDDLILVANVSTGKHGYLKKNGSHAFKGNYMQAHRMVDGVAWVSESWPSHKPKPNAKSVKASNLKKKNRESKKSVTGGEAPADHKPWKLINAKGEVVYTLPMQASLMDSEFNSGLCRVQLDKKNPKSIVYLNTKGEQPMRKSLFFNGHPRFHEGFAILGNGVVDLKSQWTLSPDEGYTLVSKKVSEGLVIGKKGKHYYLIAASTGKVVSQLPFGIRPTKQGSSCGLICVSDNSDPRKYGYINRSGRWVIKPAFIQASAFNNGYATVRLEDYKTVAVINHLGKVIQKSEKPKR